jgi:hypothetical protein
MTTDIYSIQARLTDDETMFMYLYGWAHLNWQHLTPKDLDLIPECYEELTRKQFIPTDATIGRNMLSMALTLSRVDNIIIEPELTPAAEWLVAYLKDVQRQMDIQNPQPRGPRQFIRLT